ncbi:dTDP-4-amino-4,6-dideoxygalactose transaminase [Francisella philomiragia]|uniref:dTDP-4-amino-4,6-dideoxygalactose transaminase n=1 Tax=Francisella philomiragia TaxID=28110 RepID=UPI0019068490|nr:dTDP-4-amino-4,6-dideoxygalactose transaminase [Francisella philomiragia]MBK2092323.1 dTDP-4-amino-4,6-dideoxygalactose transaminase [Francisella philomiragia]MBK2257397.1 dTDP-4-amino-4,6-dideoxygalactose transaminase [Francisella philomiragia]MBK2270103.1 dTDP-4-amino-4,6-dideoxygalactose transaminase [Francisella philomiragia]MBK2271992.1 dTDP-4-amino-4,6-dideoxygalactose transaminase [Francisella philomiragia]MBK2275773.1 dTDP-4-amino-4,6-dideoxygalactose transaminase [Francisella philo
MIPFNKPCMVGNTIDMIRESFDTQKVSGDGTFTKKCNKWLESNFGCKKALLTTSCTHALEMAAMLIDIQAGDEVIMPSYTFVSTANAFILRGAKVVFVDIRPDTMNIDETKIEAAITPKTKAIVPVHYAGVACEMDTIMEIANRYGLYVVEDAAQGVKSTYKGKALGTIGDIGCFSFHETKNYSMGEGGAIIINNPDFVERAEIIREKGTDRSKFLRGQVDKYTWVDMGSSYLPSDINAAYLYSQLKMADEINDKRIVLWDEYAKELKELEEKGYISLPKVPSECKHNAHMFYIKTKSLEERTNLIEYLKDNGIMAVFHYVPLHSSPFGEKYTSFNGNDIYTTKDSERLIRLPMYYGLEYQAVNYIAKQIRAFFNASKR